MGDTDPQRFHRLEGASCGPLAATCPLGSLTLVGETSFRVEGNDSAGVLGACPLEHGFRTSSWCRGPSANLLTLKDPISEWFSCIK